MLVVFYHSAIHGDLASRTYARVEPINQDDLNHDLIAANVEYWLDPHLEKGLHLESRVKLPYIHHSRYFLEQEVSY